MDTMVEVDHLTRRFGALVAVDDISFTVGRGEVLGFLGPNGAGKSTTMKMVTGFIRPDAGRVRIGGDDMTERPLAAKRRIGYLPEGAPLYGDMSARSFLEFIAAVRGFRGAERQRRIDHVVERVSLGSVLERPIETLSKGFKRRVGLAQAILHDPEVLVLDEPTDGLDPNQKHEVRGLIREMAAEKAIVLSTHILEEVDAVCTRAVIIAAGRVVSDGTPAELEARSPRHNAVTLALRGDGTAGARAALAAIDGVAAVEVLAAGDGQLRLRLLPRDGVALLGPVSALVHERGWELAELQLERGRLDEVFREVTTAAAGRS